MLNLVFFGPPGAGKGTQAAKVAKHFDQVHVSTGDILRAEIELQTELGHKVSDYIHIGELVPDNMLIEIIERVYDKHKGARGFVFDGFPRTLPQAEALDDLMGRKKCRINRVISLQVSQDELLRRLVNRALEEGRKDDTEEVIYNRLIVYHRHTKPLIDYYKRQGLYTEIPGIGSVDTIFNAICTVVEE